jgi:nicotinamidase-related amidase
LTQTLDKQNMTENSQTDPHSGPFRSPLLMNASDSAVVVIDVQVKLLPHIANHQRLEWNVLRLLEGAGTLGVAVCGTEQYPQGLGSTVASIAGPLTSLSQHEIPDKTMFSCRECIGLFNALSNSGVHNLLLCGIETHVCVAQSALDLLAQGFNVFVCVDAVGSRSPEDHQIGIRRMENCGATLTTTEAALFEWCENSSREQFKAISKLVQQSEPETH